MQIHCQGRNASVDLPCGSKQFILQSGYVLLLPHRRRGEPHTAGPNGDSVVGGVEVVGGFADTQIPPINTVGRRETVYILSGVDIANISPRVGFIHDGQFHADNALAQLRQTGLCFAEQVGRKGDILPYLRGPNPADFFDRSIIEDVVLAVIDRRDADTLVRFNLVAHFINGLDFRAQGNQGRGTFGMIHRKGNIEQISAKLHCLHGILAEIREVIQESAVLGVSHGEITAMGFQQL